MNWNNFKFIFIIISLTVSIFMRNNIVAQNYEYLDSLQSQKKHIALKKTNIFIVGNFEGCEKDTIFFHYFSCCLNKSISEIPSSDNEWEDIIAWFRDYRVETFFTYKKDTLKIGEAYGLYCLMNLGDVNSDGMDEFAFVIDKLDDSRLNSCKIYKICQSQFYLAKSFSLNESSFDTPISGTTDSIKGIRGFLEKKNNTWYYCNVDDYDDEKFPVMRILDLDDIKCTNFDSF